MNAILPLILSAVAATPAPGRPTEASGSTVVVVELFTSQGCSSCPPADALLARLAKEGLPGTRILGLSEHVDYWDGPGWRDPFSSAVFTHRQDAYARRLGLDTIYTPQAVVDGEAQVLGGDAAALRAAILRAAGAPRGRLTLRRSPEGVAVEGAWPGGGRATVMVALVEDGVVSRVTGGENAGRTLRHEGVVRWLGAAGEGEDAFRGAVALPPAGQGRFRVVAFAQATRTGRILAAGELVYAPGS